ncbi:DUF2865 domain-containing protein [Pinisolibacter sp.]|uniref:DUF2865 domain-containing protein n=1 Tax=Pinisolibacter sp. TaxID=2172024 RepID=UPI002FDD8386
MTAARRLGTARRATAAVRRAATIVGAVVAVALSAASAEAQSYVCNDLAAKLASLEKRASSSPADRWAAAIAEQKQAITQNRASQARCGNPFDPRCAALVERGQKMAANLASLERQHARMGGGGGASNEQARLRTLMTQLRCGERQQPGAQPITATFDGTRSRVTINGAAPGQSGVTYRIAQPGETPPGVRTEPRQENRGLFGFLFGGGGNSAGDPEPSQEQVIDPTTAQMLSGSYRTLCVRTCDGYFFPISFNASQGRLRTDANVCKALCPAAETRLYYHHNPGQEAEQAIAADGTGDPLTRLPNAFRYRTEVVPDCTCGKPDLRLLPPGAGGLRGTREAGLATGDLPLPRVKPDMDEDPETQAVTVAGLTVEPVSPQPQSETVADASSGDPGAPPKVRIVGPQYFSDR